LHLVAATARITLASAKEGLEMLHRAALGRMLATGLFAVALFGLVALGFESAAAATKPSVTWGFRENAISAGARPTLSFTALAAVGDLAAVQVLVGHTWQTLSRVQPAASGSGRWVGKRSRQGRFRYRVVLLKGGHAVAVGAPARLYVYAEVPLANLLSAKERSVVLKQKTYRYVWTASAWSRYTIFFLGSPTCRSLKLTMAYLAPSSTTAVANVATLVVIQRNSSSRINVSSGDIGSLSVNLAGAFEIALENAPGRSYGNGHADCWSSNGR
jgi:hypothetical protein